MNALVPYTFDDTPIRVEDRDGQPWFVLADVCRALSISNVGDAAARLDDDERDNIGIPDAIGRMRSTVIVNESGLWALVLTSRKAQAKRFRKWVTCEVIPSIRRSGSYGAGLPAAELDNDTLRALLLGKLDQVDALAPKAEAFDRIAAARGALSLTEAAKALKIARKDLIRWMMEHRWIYRRPTSGSWLGYREKEIAGLLEHRVARIPREDGTERIVDQVLVTAKGMSRLAEQMPAA